MGVKNEFFEFSNQNHWTSCTIFLHEAPILFSRYYHHICVTYRQPTAIYSETPSTPLQKFSQVPADVILLRTTEKTGSCFIRTDQLDGETDWKLRLAVSSTQKLTVKPKICPKSTKLSRFIFI